MSSQANKNNYQETSYNPETEEQRKRLRDRIIKRMSEPDVERRIQQRQKELLQQALGHKQSPADPKERALLEKVRRQYCEQRAQQGRIGALQIVREDIEQEIRRELEEEVANSLELVPEPS